MAAHNNYSGQSTNPIILLGGAPVRSDSKEDDHFLDAHLTLVHSLELSVPKQQLIESPPSNPKIRNSPNGSPPRGQDAGQTSTKRPRSKSRGRRDRNITAPPQFPRMNWRPSKKNLAVPLVVEASDDDEDENSKEKRMMKFSRGNEANSLHMHQSYEKSDESSSKEPVGEQILQQELEKAENSTSVNNRQRQRKKSQSKKKSKYHIEDIHSNDFSTFPNANSVEAQQAHTVEQFDNFTETEAPVHGSPPYLTNNNDYKLHQHHDRTHGHVQHVYRPKAVQPTFEHIPPSSSPAPPNTSPITPNETSLIPKDPKSNNQQPQLPATTSTQAKVDSIPLQVPSDVKIEVPHPKFQDSTHAESPPVIQNTEESQKQDDQDNSQNQTNPKAPASSPPHLATPVEISTSIGNPDYTLISFRDSKGAQQSSSLLVPPGQAYSSKRITLDDQLATFEKDGNNSSDSIDDIDSNRYYIQDTKVKVEEDDEHEFKAVQNTKQPLERIVGYCRKYIVSFLNANGGTLYFGVEDDGAVKGLPFSRKGRDMLRLGIDVTTNSIKPQVDPHLVKVLLIPVEVDEKSMMKKSNRAQQANRTEKSDSSNPRFVVEVHIGKGNAPVYLTSDGSAYFRRSGSVYKMDSEMIQRRKERGRPSFNGDVPAVPKDFIGRHDEIEQIQHYVLPRQNQKTLIILLHGLPMAGKSTLARQLVDTWASLWADACLFADMKGISSHYVDHIEAQVFVIRSVYPILQLPPSKSEVSGMYQSCFSNKRAILLLENVGRVEQVKSMLPGTAKSILMIVTSRRDLPLDVEFDCISIKLGALSAPSAIQLLRSVMNGKGPQFGDQIAMDIVKLCGCMPLPVRLIGSSVARMPQVSSVEYLLKSIKDDDQKRMDYIIDHFSTFVEQYSDGGDELPASENNVSSNDRTINMANYNSNNRSEDGPPQDFLLSLSVFPSSFDSIAVSHFWNMSIEDASSILLSLVESNEIDMSQDKTRFFQNDLFRVWCTKRAMDRFGEAGMIKWKTVFAEYYLNLMHKCSEFYRKGFVMQGLELLVSESANFEAAIGYGLEIKDWDLCATSLMAIEELNKYFGTGEQRKWEKLRKPLDAVPEVMEAYKSLLSPPDQDQTTSSSSTGIPSTDPFIRNSTTAPTANQLSAVTSAKVADPRDNINAIEQTTASPMETDSHKPELTITKPETETANPDVRTDSKAPPSATNTVVVPPSSQKESKI